MKKKLAVFNFLPSDTEVIKVKLPYGTSNAELEFAQGDVLVAEDIVDGEKDIYKGELVTAATQEVAIIFNQGVYEDDFGNRTGYVVNPSYIRYKSGDIVTMVRFAKNIKLQISEDAIDGTIKKGDYLIPQVATAGTDTTYRLKVTSTDTDVTSAATALKIEVADTKIPIGNSSVTAPILRAVK